MSKDKNLFPAKMTVMSLIIAMGTLFAIQPAGAMAQTRPGEGEQNNPRSREQNQQQCNPDTDENCVCHPDKQNQNEDQNRQQQACNPKTDKNCRCVIEDQNSQDQNRERRNDQNNNQNQQQDQNQNRDNQNCDQQQQPQQRCQQPDNQNQNQQQTRERTASPTVSAATAVEQDSDEYNEMGSFYYDTGWVPVQSGTSYMFNHNFGSIPTYVVVQECGALNKDTKECEGEVVIAGEHGYQDGQVLINPIGVNATKDSIRVVMGNFWAWGTWDSQHGWQCPGDEDNNCNTAYYRVQAFK